MSTDLAPAFSVRNRNGSTSDDLDTVDLGAVLGQLGDADDDHRRSSVALTHHTGWSIEAFSSGRLVLTHPSEAPRRLSGATPELIAGLWASLSVGDLDTIEAQAWRPVDDAA